MFVHQIMSQPAQTVAPTDSARVAVCLMARFNIGALPVCDAGELIGLVTDRDLVVECLAPGYLPSELPVRQVMSAHPITIEPSETLETAAAMFAEYGVRRLPVAHEGRLLGMLSADDVALRFVDAIGIADMEMTIALAQHATLPHTS